MCAYTVEKNVCMYVCMCKQVMANNLKNVIMMKSLQGMLPFNTFTHVKQTLKGNQEKPLETSLALVSFLSIFLFSFIVFV